MKIKESEMSEKYLELARELRKLWNMKVIVIPVVAHVLGKIPKGFERGLEELEIGGRIENTALLRSARILRRVLETCGDLLSLKLL